MATLSTSSSALPMHSIDLQTTNKALGTTFLSDGRVLLTLSSSIRLLKVTGDDSHEQIACWTLGGSVGCSVAAQSNDVHVWVVADGRRVLCWPLTLADGAVLTTDSAVATVSYASQFVSLQVSSLSSHTAAITEQREIVVYDDKCAQIALVPAPQQPAGQLVWAQLTAVFTEEVASAPSNRSKSKKSKQSTANNTGSSNSVEKKTTQSLTAQSSSRLLLTTCERSADDSRFTFTAQLLMPDWRNLASATCHRYTLPLPSTSPVCAFDFHARSRTLAILQQNGALTAFAFAAAPTPLSRALSSPCSLAVTRRLANVDTSQRAAVCFVGQSHLAVLLTLSTGRLVLSVWDTLYGSLSAVKQLHAAVTASASSKRPNSTAGPTFSSVSQLSCHHRHTAPSLAILPHSSPATLLICQLPSNVAVTPKLSSVLGGLAVSATAMLQEPERVSLQPSTSVMIDAMSFFSPSSAPHSSSQDSLIDGWIQKLTSESAQLSPSEHLELVQECLNEIATQPTFSVKRAKTESSTRSRNAIPQRFIAAVGRHCAQHSALFPSLFQLIVSDQFSVRYCPTLIASFIQQRQLGLLEQSLLHIPDLFESDLVAILIFALDEMAQPTRLLMPDADSSAVAPAAASSSTKKKKGKKESVTKSSSQSANLESKSTSAVSPKEQCARISAQRVEAHDHELEALLNLIVSSPKCTDFVLESLKALSFDHTLTFLRYLAKWLERYWVNSEDKLKADCKGPRLPTLSQILDWLSMLMDSHFIQLIMSSSETFELLRGLQHLIASQHLPLCERMETTRGILRHFISSSKAAPRKPLLDYSVEVLTM